MTLEEASKIIDRLTEDTSPIVREKTKDALKLAIEALKYVNEICLPDGTKVRELLPGETE